MGPSPIETVGNCQKSGISHGMRIRGQSRMIAQLVAEVLEMLLVQPAFDESARIHPGEAWPW